MANVNIFQVQGLLETALKDMFAKDMIFKGVDVGNLDNNDFIGKDSPEDSVGLLIQQAGYKVDALRGKRSFKQQRFKYFWRLSIVCPSDIYDTYGGDRHKDVITKLMGYKLSEDYTEINWIDDERDFNEPELANNLMYTPMMFEVQAVLTGDK